MKYWNPADDYADEHPIKVVPAEFGKLHNLKTKTKAGFFHCNKCDYKIRFDFDNDSDYIQKSRKIKSDHYLNIHKLCPECENKGGFEGRSDEGPSNCRTCKKGNKAWDKIEELRNKEREK